MKEEFGGYITYVFQNLDPTTWRNEYIMLVRFPHWEAPFPQIGEVGFLSFKEVVAGQDKWWDKYTQTNIAYNYDNVIFLNFIRENKQEPAVLL